ncbi:MAG: FimV/HubP family polar landmark protein [Xanthomonadales bacterium]
MNTANHFSTRLILGAALLVFSQIAWSLGLGEAKVESFLGQPLEVRIKLITRPTDDLASVSASLASAADYQLIGASRDDVSVPLRFSVEDLDGDAYIAVSSRLSINNPVVRLILEVNWSNGRMLREYTLFLDPPTFSQPAPAPRIKAGSAAEKAIEAPPAAATSDLGDADVLGLDDYGPVQSGDTLWRIAKDWSAGSGLNLNKVMLAIQRQNPQAFSRNNINLLQRGVILRMPQRDEVNSISVVAANDEVKDQIDQFQSRRNINLASPAVPLLAEESIAVEPAASEQLPSASADLAAPDSVPSQLELLPPSEDNALDSTYGFEESQAAADDAVSAQALREELSRKEEELINQQQQNTYLEQRLQELESQLAESREGVVEDKNLASMEERLRRQRLDDAQTAVPKVVPAPDQDEPWYKRFSLWLLGLLVLLAVVVGWLMSRRGSSDTVVSDLGGAPDPLRKIKDEVGDQAVRQEAAQEVTTTGTEAEAEAPDAGESEDTKTMPVRKNFPDEDEDAQVLDEESADPEIQLDLARAYISMHDKEAARVILEEVIVNGSEEQQAEAKKMKDLL